jgi:hypothetical protein
MTEVATGPVMTGPDDAPVDLPDGTTKNMIDLVAGDFVCTWRGGPPFEVLTNEDQPEPA